MSSWIISRARKGAARRCAGTAGAAIALALAGVTSAQGALVPFPGSPVSTGAGSKPNAVAVADVNGDTRPDLIVADRATTTTAGGSGGGYSVLLGDSLTGGFSLLGAARTATAGDPVAVSTGDFNEDGKVDFVLADKIAAGVRVFLGDGTGHFTQTASSPVSLGGSLDPFAIFTTNTGADAHADVIVTVGASSAPTYRGAVDPQGVGAVVLRGTGTGDFSTPLVSRSTARAPAPTATVADVNNDGKPDIVYGENLVDAQSGVSVTGFLISYGSGDGVYYNDCQPFIGYDCGPVTEQAVSTPAPVRDVSTAELNGNSFVDLVGAEDADSPPGTGGLVVAYANSSGAFTSVKNFPAGGAGVQVAAGRITDTDPIGDAALLVNTGSVLKLTTLRQPSIPNFGLVTGDPQPVTGGAPVGTGAADLVAAQLAGDSRLDLAVPNAGSANLTLYGAAEKLVAGASSNVSDAAIGETVHFTGAPTTGGAPPRTYSWAFDAAGSSCPANPRTAVGFEPPSGSATIDRAFDTGGAHSALLCVMDDIGQVSAAPVVQVCVGATTSGGICPLTVSASSTPAKPITGQAITATVSAFGGAKPYTYSWRVDGGPPVPEANSPTFTFAGFSTTGAHTITATVTDNAPTPTVVTKTLTITVAAPVAAALAVTPATPEPGQAVTFDAGKSSGGVAPLTYAFDLDGNGSCETSATAASKTTVGGGYPAGSHKAGVCVTDSAGHAATATATFNVVAAPVAALSAPAPAETGTDVTFDAGGTRGGVAPLTYAFSVDGGSFGAAGPSTRLTRSFADAGTHTVAVRVTDARGKTSTASSSVVILTKLIPDFTYTPAAPEDGQVVTLDAGISKGTDAKTYFDWDVEGDGSYKNATQPGVTTTQTTFDKPGTFKVGLRLRAADGRTRTIVKSIVVKNGCVHVANAGMAQMRSDNCIHNRGTTASPRWQVTGNLTLNGVPITSTGTSTLDAGTPSTFTLGSGGLTVGKTTLLKNAAMSWTIPAAKKGSEAQVADIGINTAVGDRQLFGLSLGAKATMFLGRTASDKAYARFALSVELPAIFSKSPGYKQAIAAQVSLKVDDAGVHTDGLKVQVADAYVGAVLVKSVCFSYAPAGSEAVEPCGFPDHYGKPYLKCNTDVSTDRWSGYAQVELPFGSGPSVGASATVAGKQLSSLGGSAEGLHLPLVEGVFLDGVGFGVCIKPPPLKLKGDVTISALSEDALSVNGSFEYDDKYKDDAGVDHPWKVTLEGHMSLFDYPLGDAELSFDASGTVEFALGAHLTLPSEEFNVASVSGEVHGFFAPGQPVKFNIGGSVSACLAGVWCIGGEGVVSSTGVGACVTLFDGTVKVLKPHGSAKQRFIGFFTGEQWVDQHVTIRGGIGYKWAEKSVHLLGTSCDLAPFSTENTRALRQVNGQPARTDGFTVAPGQQLVTLQVTGATAPPKLVLTGPDGRTITSPVLSPGEFVKDDHLIMENVQDRTTNVAIVRPAAGNWTIAAQPGSSGITTTARSGVADPPAVTAAVGKRHGTYRLRYAVSAAPNESVTFVERANHLQQTLGTARGLTRRCGKVGTPPAGRRAPSCGEITFDPALGKAGRRSIVAIVERDGQVVSDHVVAGYIAPKPALPGKPKKLQVRRAGKIAVITFGSLRDIVRFNVTVDASDGRHLVYTTSPLKRAVVVDNMLSTTRLDIHVRGVRRDIVEGHSAHAVLKARKVIRVTRSNTGRRRG